MSYVSPEIRRGATYLPPIRFARARPGFSRREQMITQASASRSATAMARADPPAPAITTVFPEGSIRRRSGPRSPRASVLKPKSRRPSFRTVLIAPSRFTPGPSILTLPAIAILCGAVTLRPRILSLRISSGTRSIFGAGNGR